MEDRHMQPSDAQAAYNEATILLGREFPNDGTDEEKRQVIAKAQVYAIMSLAERMKELTIATNPESPVSQ